MDIIYTIREKRIEESEKAYMLLYISGMVPEVESDFCASIEQLAQRGKIRNISNATTVRDLVKHIKIHAINAYSAKLKVITKLKHVALAAKKLGGTISLDYEDFRAVNMFHNEFVVMKIEKTFSMDLQKMTSKLIDNV